MSGSKENAVTIALSGRIDSNNAAEAESMIMGRVAGREKLPVVLDMTDLQFISSAGLRVILRLKKKNPDLRLTCVSPEVYDILEMTGFTEMMSVEKAYRVVSVDGCEVIGEGANGKVYRIDGDNVVKTYKNADALKDIQHEREVARLALVLGIPTAISYDVVKVGDSYGSVFELLDAKSFAKILAKEPERFDWCVKEYVGMLKKIHSTVVPAGKLPSHKENMLARVKRTAKFLPEGYGNKLIAMTEAIPESDHMVHGDYHTKNIVLAGDEVLVIDMDTLSVGHPIFDLVHMYSSYVGYSENDPETVLKFQGFTQETALRFWHESLAAYLGTKDGSNIKEVEDKVRCLAYGYLIDWGVRHNADEALIGVWKARLTELLPRVDCLTFEIKTEEGNDINEIEVAASAENLQKVMDFVDSRLEAAGCPVKYKMQFDLAVEEIFVNIANYAYAPGTGNACVRVELSDDPKSVAITFTDSGKPFDPTKKADPDVTLSADERDIGGLGIFMTKKIMDDLSYEYRDGKNVLRIKKNI